MTATAGYNGSVKLGSNVVAQVKSYNFDLDRMMEDITSMSISGTPSAAKQFLPTLYEMGCSLNVNWDLTDTNGQLAMQNAWINATLLTFTLTPNNGTNTYTFSAFIKKIAIKDDVSKIVDSTIDLQPTGALTTT